MCTKTVAIFVLRFHRLHLEILELLLPLGGGHVTHVLPRLLLELLDEFTPKLLSAGDLMRIAHLAPVLHDLVVADQYAVQLQQVRAIRGHPEHSDVIAQLVHGLPPLRVASEDFEQGLQLAVQLGLLDGIEQHLQDGPADVAVENGIAEGQLDPDLLVENPSDISGSDARPPQVHALPSRQGVKQRRHQALGHPVDGNHVDFRRRGGGKVQHQPQDDTAHWLLHPLHLRVDPPKGVPCGVDHLGVTVVVAVAAVPDHDGRAQGRHPQPRRKHEVPSLDVRNGLGQLVVVVEVVAGKDQLILAAKLEVSAVDVARLCADVVHELGVRGLLHGQPELERVLRGQHVSAVHLVIGVLEGHAGGQVQHVRAGRGHHLRILGR
eukprot:RCo055704